MRATRSIAALAIAVLGSLGAAPAAAVTDDERTAIYMQFRALFDAGSYQEALPMAEQLVTATEQQYGAKDRALVNPLANVGTTQLRLGNFAAAENAYTRALTILDSTATTTDRARLRPLQGLGLSSARSAPPLQPRAGRLRPRADQRVRRAGPPR